VCVAGGKEAAKGRWSWQVAILNKYREVFCGGTLVAPGWVLTAAHCVRKHLFVKLGEHDLMINEVGYYDVMCYTHCHMYMVVDDC